MNKYSPFTDKYPSGEERKRLILKIEKESQTKFRKSVKHSKINYFTRHFDNREYMKDTFLKINGYLYSNFNNKNDIIDKDQINYSLGKNKRKNY